MHPVERGDTLPRLETDYCHLGFSKREQSTAWGRHRFVCFDKAETLGLRDYTWRKWKIRGKQQVMTASTSTELSICIQEITDRPHVHTHTHSHARTHTQTNEKQIKIQTNVKYMRLCLSHSCTLCTYRSRMCTQLHTHRKQRHNLKNTFNFTDTE